MLEEPRPGIIILGTAHIAATSVAEVESTLRERRPKKVLVELDARRLEALRDPEAWRRTDVIKIIKEKKQHLFLLQLYLAAMQARMGRETGVPPGTEMLRAVQVADEIGAEVVLIDRDVSVTLRRGFGALGFWRRLRLLWRVWREILAPAPQEELDIEALLETDMISRMTEEFAAFAPEIKEALIDERDAYMASHIEEQARGLDGDLVAIVGAGHVPGMVARLPDASSIDRTALETVATRRVTVGKVVGILLPLAVIAAFVVLALRGDWQGLREAGLAWILVNGGLSALGAAIALAHPLSILTAFIAAPFTSLNPTLAAGWFAGLVEAKKRTPTVQDFEEVRKISTMKDFWKNGVVRILLVTALANLGSIVGTYIGAAKVAEVLGT